MNIYSHPKISVVTPSYNQGQFIEDAIISVLDQGYPEFEHIIIDNCSTDNTIEVLKKYSHLIWISEPDRGQSHGLNKGFQLARGEWILWLNADDYLMPGVMGIFANATAKHPLADFFYGHVRFVDAHKKIIKTVYHIPYSYALIFYRFFIPPSTGSLFRATLLKEKPLADDYHYGMDVEWFLRCGKGLRAILLDHVISSFRVSGVNKTSQHITSNILLPRQMAERIAYQEKHIFSRWPALPRKGKEVFYSIGRYIYRIVYYSRKLRYADRYLKQRFEKRRSR